MAREMYAKVPMRVWEVASALPRESQRNALLAAYVVYFFTGEIPDMPKNIYPQFLALKADADKRRTGIQTGSKWTEKTDVEIVENPTLEKLSNNSKNLESISRVTDEQLENVSIIEQTGELPAETTSDPREGVQPKTAPIYKYIYKNKNKREGTSEGGGSSKEAPPPQVVEFQGVQFEMTSNSTMIPLRSVQ